ncbi:gluconate transporter [Emticicia oligotrophica DSM 17448]|uniref:Gluconate transporter n=1 Tax=Emticicia oligotrophica (strain DSM 17448 / CIP 109782 / MTCC 6937 / GPTSA100-15) TaxID=929562 RepID=A0ABN4APS9_EMTOG|nr:gluconate:H+ symporter [Emticicia oligotrophica]AFK04176.1 gluconate transporter [Emticicia oligotrophica DSM 17448]
MPIFLTFLAILVLILLVAYVKLDTFVSFILVAIGLGLATGMDVSSIGKSIQSGIGGTLGDLILIIGFGAMLGKLVAESGAAQRITDALIQLFGQKYLQWGLALAGFIIGIPLFYNAGFIIVVPLIFSIAASARLPLLYVGMPMLTALSVAHGYLPPHPSPAAIASQLKADVGQTLIYGIIVAIPAIAIAGVLFGRTLKRFNPKIEDNLFAIKDIPKEQQPSLIISLLVALMPVFLLTFTSAIKKYAPESEVIKLISEPYIGMLISLLLAVYLLGVRQGNNIKIVSKQLDEAFKSSAGILLIIAGAGALKQILKDSGTSDYIGAQLQGFDINPLILGWAIAGVLRVCVGSATIAGLTAVGILAPLIQQQTGVKPELMVLSIGAGSLMFSHLNDGGFWLFKEYFNLSIKDTLKTWTVMETLVSIIGLIGVLILNLFV